MTGERTLPVSRDAAWHALNDLERLRAAIPGCEAILANANGGYDVAMNAAIGPVRARFKGTMTLADVEAPHRYTLRFESQGGQAGFARGEARIALEDGASSAQTTLRYVVAAQVGGRLAQVGSRLIDAAAAAMADQFFDRFVRELASLPQSPTAAAAAAAPGAPQPAKLGLWALVLRLLRHLHQK